jgi:hypothetical protein
MKRLIRKILREEIDKSDKHYRILDKISDHVQLPYFKSMEGLTIYEHNDQEYIMRKLLGNISIELLIDKRKYILDDKGYEIYYESSKGYWEKREYNDNGKIMLYYEDSHGNIRDNR